MSTGIVVFLYIFLHELGHMSIMLSAGATITDFSIFTAHVSAIGGVYTDLSCMCMHVNGSLFPFIIAYVYTLFYQKDNTSFFYRIFSYVVIVISAASICAWVVNPFVYLLGTAPINDNVTKFLTVFSAHYHPLIVSAAAVVLIGMNVVLMIKKISLYNLIKNVSRKERQLWQYHRKKFIPCKISTPCWMASAQN